MLLMDVTPTSPQDTLATSSAGDLVEISIAATPPVERAAKKPNWTALAVSSTLHVAVLVILACCGWQQVVSEQKPFDVVVDATDDFEPAMLTRLDMPLQHAMRPIEGEITYGIPGGRSSGSKAAVSVMQGLPGPASSAINVPAMSNAAFAHILSDSWGGDGSLADRHEMVGLGNGKLRGRGSGTGTGNGIGDGDATEFFGLAPLGKRIVYVLDASLSMNRPHDSEANTRFKRVKIELVNSIGNLPAESQFFIIFFNDYSVAMPAPGLEPATLGAKQKYLTWMQGVMTAGNTEPTLALAQALKMRPDIVYFLSDGDFNLRVKSELMDLPVGHSKLQAVAFEEPMTDAGRDAFDLIEKGKIAAAQKLVPSKDYKRIAMAWRGQKFLRELSERHNGKLVLVP